MPVFAIIAPAANNNESPGKKGVATKPVSQKNNKNSHVLPFNSL